MIQDWHALESQRNYRRECRWLAFRSAMYCAWPWIALIVASFVLPWH